MVEINLPDGINQFEFIRESIMNEYIDDCVNCHVDIEITNVEPILTIENISWEEFKKFNLFKSDIGLILYKYIESPKEDYKESEEEPFKINEVQLNKILKDIENKGKKLVEIPETKTYNLNVDFEFDFYGVLRGRTQEDVSNLLKINLFEYLKKAYQEKGYPDEIFSEINEKNILLGNRDIVFPKGEALMNIPGYKLDGFNILEYITHEYNFPVSKRIINHENLRINFIKDYLSKFVKLSKKSNNYIDFLNKLDKLNNSDTLPIASYEEAYTHINDIARRYKDYKRTNEAFKDLNELIKG